MADLSKKMCDLVNDNGIFARDEVTGLCKSCLTDAKYISPKQAKVLWLTHFKDRIRMRVPNADGQTFRLKQLCQADLDLLWENIFERSTFNSRKQMYDAIPQWDGVKRLDTFMKDYFLCDTNPNFFKLFMTCVIGMMDDPSRNVVPYFFDFVSGTKGTGKTSFFKHLVGEQNVCMVKATSRRDDFFVNIYDQNALIACDDECCLVGTSATRSWDKWTYDELKAFITATLDKFSRKFQQPESHPRSFVFVRTSNDVMTVYSPNERRQIIFKIGLPEHTCLHWALSQDYMDQLKAEAKQIYEDNDRHIYNLTDEDWCDIARQNVENFNTETDDYQTVLKFIRQLHASPLQNEKFITKIQDDRGNWVSWRGYNEWRKAHNENPIESRRFAKIIATIAALEPQLISYSANTVRVQDVSTMIHAARLQEKVTANETITAENIDVGL